jgi:hypothetical protein
MNSPAAARPMPCPSNTTQAALDALRAWNGTGHRILVMVTDGGISCGQLGSRSGFTEATGLDNSASSVDVVRLGALSVKIGASGRCSGANSRRSRYIAP